jgi:hypothetical protein
VPVGLRATPQKQCAAPCHHDATLDENGLDEPQSPSVVLHTGAHFDRFQRGWSGKVNG